MNASHSAFSPHRGAYRRTSKGQALAVHPKPPGLDEDQRRLLLMVNGFTPLDALAELAGFQRAPEDLIVGLEASGLVTDEACKTEGDLGGDR
jgi:hypothetical protein